MAGSAGIRILNPGRAAAAALLLAALVGAGGSAGQAWSEFGTPAREAPAAGTEIREPFFEFLLAVADADSLGSWTGEDVRRFAEDRGRTSKFPLSDLLLVERVRPTSFRGGGAQRPVAVWTLELSAPLDKPMPYDILGYHPGSLRVSRRLVLEEVRFGSQRLDFEHGRQQRSAALGDVRLFAITEGKVVLDADGFVDALLGAALDDAWTLGFATAWEGESRLGLGVSLGRNGRRIFGEFDFVNDKVLPNGREEASALSSFCRRWLEREKERLPAVWEE
ncbi:MAG: hypothetical protein AB7V45_06830 [Candidatus Krumholzibacteriia bacterium]